MSVAKNQHGFTLIEITLVLAISAGLLTIVLAGQEQVRSRAEFTAAVNQVATDINEVKNESQTTVQVQTPGAATNPTGTSIGTTFFGKAMTFTQGASTITVQDMYNNASGILQLPNSYQFTIPWGVTVQSASSPQYLVFHLTSASAQLITYANPPSPYTATDLYNETVPNDQTGTFTLQLTDPDGHMATIYVDGAKNGAVTETFL